MDENQTMDHDRIMKINIEEEMKSSYIDCKFTNLISKISKISVYLTFNRLFVLFLNIKRRYFIHFSMVNILSFVRFPKI